MMPDRPLLIVILGPTAVGKTALSIEVAKALQTEIISADSRQFYREMNIGTAKPSPEELATVPHHFINNLSVKDDYSAGKFEKEALHCLKNIFEKHKTTAVMVGGSGLYIKAVCEGMDEFPEVPHKIRESLIRDFKKEGLEALVNKLHQLDPASHQTIELQNPQRVIRALEICLGTGKPYSSFKQKRVVKRPFRILKIGLEMERQKLYSRINKRVDMMMENGLLEEVKSLEKFKGCNALETVGYKEFFDHLEGKHDLQTAIELVKRNSRRYAKRQLTWFRKEQDIHWFEPSATEAVISMINKQAGIV